MPLSFFTYICINLLAFHPDDAACGDLFSVQFGKRAAHGTLRSPVRQEDHLHTAVLIRLSLLHHGGNAYAVPGKFSGNQREHARLILGQQAHEMHA